MNDLELLHEIEKEIEIPLVQLTPKEFSENPYAPIRGYTVDEQGRVTGLRLSFTQIRDLSILAGFDVLTTLNLTFCPYISDVDSLKELKSLTTLDLSYNNISDVSFIANLPNLNTIDLDENKIVSYDHRRL